MIYYDTRNGVLRGGMLDNIDDQHILQELLLAVPFPLFHPSAEFLKHQYQNLLTIPKNLQNDMISFVQRYPSQQCPKANPSCAQKQIRYAMSYSSVAKNSVTCGSILKDNRIHRTNHNNRGFHIIHIYSNIRSNE